MYLGQTQNSHNLPGQGGSLIPFIMTVSVPTAKDECCRHSLICRNHSEVTKNQPKILYSSGVTTFSVTSEKVLRAVFTDQQWLSRSCSNQLERYMCNFRLTLSY